MCDCSSDLVSGSTRGRQCQLADDDLGPYAFSRDLCIKVLCWAVFSVFAKAETAKHFHEVFMRCIPEPL